MAGLEVSASLAVSSGTLSLSVLILAGAVCPLPGDSWCRGSHGGTGRLKLKAL